ncbi:MAG: LCP family protein [Treponema sp.]|jgi:anionic cell wall polymer biosynthesis LytR-Cps2A-Psr (LCP) family protein|nr:LCP family protein [Treponema sp.]
MRKTKFDASVLLLVLITVMLCVGGVMAFLTLHSDPIDEALAGDRVINTLFVIENDGAPLCSYVLMYYPATGRSAIFDVPGAVGLIIQKLNRVDRIDTVYEQGRIAPYEAEIEGLLGIDISFNVVMDTVSLGKLVDLLEGVDLFIPSPVELYGADGPVLFPSGLTRLDGDQASLYVSYEAPGELASAGVLRRQHFFLGFIKRMKELREEGAYLDNRGVSELFQSFLMTNLTERARSRLFGAFSRIDTDRVTIQTVDGNEREVSGRLLILPLYNGNLIKEVVRKSLAGLVRPTDSPEGDRVYTVEVLNGTRTNGLATRTADLLRSFGYDVLSAGNANSQDYERTLILDRSGSEAVAAEFGDIIRCANIRAEEAAYTGQPLNPLLHDERADFTLIIGRDFDGRYVTGN